MTTGKRKRRDKKKNTPNSQKVLVVRKPNNVEQPSPKAVASQMHMQIHAGPLPHPDILRGYDDLVPGSAEQIISLFVSQANHRMSLEKTVVSGDSRRAYLGLSSGFVLSVLILGISYILIVSNRPIEGFVLIVGEIAALAGVFVYGTATRRKERETKYTTKDKK